MFEQLIDALQQYKAESTAQDFAEAIWLALQIRASKNPDFLPEQHAASGAPQLTGHGKQKDLPPDPPQPIPPEAPTASMQPNRSVYPAPWTTEITSRDPTGISIYPKPGIAQRTGGDTAGLPISISSATQVPDGLELGRVLRLLKRPLYSEHNNLLDDAATAEQIAEAHDWQPVWQAFRSRWFDLALIIDQHVSMRVWQRIVEELRTRLEQYGAFQGVHVWGIDTSATHAVEISTLEQRGQAKRRISPEELIDPTGHRLFLVVSDCVAPAWHSRKVVQTFQIWHNSPTALLQLLPTSLWRHTALHDVTSVRLRSLAPGTPNHQLLAGQLRRISDPLPPGLNMPVLALNTRWFAKWAQLCMGGAEWMPGVRLPLDTSSEEPIDDFNTSFEKSPERLVRQFRAMASPLAFELAGLFATSMVLNLGIMRLIQKELLPTSDHSHLAEVLYSGLLEVLNLDQTDDDPNDVRYDFAAGIRQEMLKSVPTNRAVRVLAGSSRFVRRYVSSFPDLYALLKDPTLPVTYEGLSPNYVHFAEIAAQVIRGLGGVYAQLADRLKQANHSRLEADKQPRAISLKRQPEYWPFDPVLSMSPEQRQAWEQTCYLSNLVDTLLADPNRSVVVSTHPGCGISTSLARIPLDQLLILPYNYDRWPGQVNAFSSSSTHLGQWLALAIHAFIEKCRQQPDSIRLFEVAPLEELSWMVQTYLNVDQSKPWFDLLQEKMAPALWQELSELFATASFANLFGDSVADVVAQIDVCLQVADQLGWRGIYAGIDIRWSDWVNLDSELQQQLREGLRLLLTTLSPLQRRGFGFKLGLPQRILATPEVDVLVRGRAIVTAYTWTPDQIQLLARRLIFLATDEPLLGEQILPPFLWEELQPDIAVLWDALGPAAAVAMAKEALALALNAQLSVDTLRQRLSQRYALTKTE